MSLLPGKKRAEVKQERIKDDWYTENRWASEQLFARVQFIGPIHDPACGEGRIVIAARHAGYEATGSDLVDRGFGETGIDFLADSRLRTTLVFNAPYKQNEEFIAHALEVASQAALIHEPSPVGATPSPEIVQDRRRVAQDGPLALDPVILYDSQTKKWHSLPDFLQNLPTQLTRQKNNCMEMKNEMEIKMPIGDVCKESIIVLCLILSVFAVYSPIIFASYAYLDDYSLLCAARRHEMFDITNQRWVDFPNLYRVPCGFPVVQTNVDNGRPLNALGFILAFKAMHGIGDLRWLRTASVLGIAAFGIASYRALKGKDLPPSVALAFPLLVAFMPPAQVYAAWTCDFLAPWSALLAGVAFAIIAPALPGRLPWRHWAAAVGILTASLAIHQSAAMMFWLYAGIAWLVPPKAPDRQDVVRAGGVMGVALVIEYALAKGLPLVLYSYNTYSRTAIATDIQEKIIWFLSHPLFDALNFPLIVPHRIIAYVALAFIASGLWLYLPGSPFMRLCRMALAVTLVPLAYLPNLLVAENWSSYRTQIAISSLVLFYAVIALVGWLRFCKLQRVLPVCLAIAVITCAGLANRNMMVEFVLPQVLEYRIASDALQNIEFGEAKDVYFILARDSDALAPVVRYDEFGHPSLASPWVPQAMAWLILKEKHSPFADRVFSRSTVVDSAPPGSTVIDFGKALRE
jgi:hypothetical protein